ncbi:MAG: hypothetical protein ACWGMZ_00210 [Thermoguttaceae bacterium]
MKLFRISVCVAFLLGTATAAMGQYGLYGSPDTISMSQQTAYASPQIPNTAPAGTYAGTYTVPAAGAYASPANYGTQQGIQAYPGQNQGATERYVTPPTQAYAAGTGVKPTSQQTQYSYPAYTAQTAQAYSAQQTQVAQPQSGVSYGPMGAQYRTSANSGQPPYYTASVDQSTSTQPTLANPQNGSADQVQPSQTPVAEAIPAPGTQQAPGLMNQMLSEQGQAGYNCGACYGGECNGAYGGECGGVRASMNRFEQSACDSLNYGCAQPCLWYASVSALAMTRDRPNKVYITYETGNLPHNDYPADEFSWEWGGEVRIGRRFCCGCNPGYWALEASYWTLNSFESYVSHTNPGGTVGTPLDVSYNEFYYNVSGFYENATNWFDNAAEHRLWRRDEVHNVEINLVRGQWCYGPDSPWDMGFGFGVRYFRFQESWRFGSLMNGFTWGQDGGADEAYLDDLITNNMVGPQVGFNLGYNIGRNLRFYMAPKVGIYNNNIQNNFRAYLGNGSISRPTAASGVTGTYPVNSSTNMLSFLSQIDVGVDWKFARQWTFGAGYRVVAISGIGLADAQIPFYTVDIPAISDIDKNGDLLLHGAYLTLGYNF